MRPIKTFKQLVKAIAQIETDDDLNNVYFDIENAFQADKISWDDHENLYTILGFIEKNI